MTMRRLFLALCLVLAGVAAAGARASGQEPARHRLPPGLDPSQAPPSAEEWRALVERDRRVGFSSRTLGLARALLQEQDKLPERRAAAWFALGAAGAADQRPALEESARSAQGLERLAAILALGELSEGGDALLQELARSSETGVGPCALLALLRTQKPALRRGVEEIAQDARDPRSGLAAELVVFAADPAQAAPGAVPRLWLELRWRAGQEFGLIDGQAWPVLVFRDLCAQPAFVGAVILRAASALDRAGVRDQLCSALLEGQGQGRLRAAARGMPRELALLVQHELWRPASIAEWELVFDELSEAHLEAYVPELFESALALPELRYRALALLARSGAEDFGTQLTEDIARLSAADRVWVARALGESGESGLTKRLAVLNDAPEPAVRAAALVAGLRLDSRKAEVTLDDALGDAQNALRPALLIELAANAHANTVELRLEEQFQKTEGELHFLLALALAREGQREAREACRELLLADPPPAPERARRLVDALRAHLSSEDLDVLHALFPRENLPENLGLNEELALALTELGDSAMQPLLHAALWRGSTEVSLLAGALVVRASGVHALRDEAANPPAEARSVDLRRVGFALGCWGGFPEVEALAQLLRFNSGAPALQGALLGFLSTRTQ